jgi:hypothetical protein
MTDCEVFELNPILDNPLYEGMASGDTPSFLGRRRVHDDFFPVNYDDWEWTLEPLAEKWKPIQVEGRTRAFNDFPCLDMMVPAFSRRAVDVLCEYLEPNGELLQLVHPAGDYYAYNCRTVVEVLDHTRTIAPWRPSQPRMTQSVAYYWMDPLRVRNLSVFRMREMPNRVFVTTPFVDRVRKQGLNGFHFIKAWPFPEGTDYWLEDKKHRQAAQQIRTSHGFTDIKAESLVICLPLESDKLSKDEKKRISSMEDDLDAQLFTPTLDDPYFGSLEGKKTAKGITKLYLSCPDAEALFGKLSDWLKALDWQPRPTVLVRNVSFDDFSAGGREVTV